MYSLRSHPAVNSYAYVSLIIDFRYAKIKFRGDDSEIGCSPDHSSWRDTVSDLRLDRCSGGLRLPMKEDLYYGNNSGKLITLFRSTEIWTPIFACNYSTCCCTCTYGFVAMVTFYCYTFSMNISSGLKMKFKGQCGYGNQFTGNTGTFSLKAPSIPKMNILRNPAFNTACCQKSLI